MTYWTLLLFVFILYLLPCLSFSYLKKISTKKVNNFIVFFGLLFHLFLIDQSTFAKGVNLNFSNTLLITSWIAVFIYWLTNFKDQYKGFEYFTLIPAIIILVFNPLVSDQSYAYEAYSSIAVIHIIIALLAYSLLAFGALFSIFLLMVEKNLKGKKNNYLGFSSRLSILDLEKVLFRVYWIGFLLLTITLITGTYFSEEAFNSTLIINHKFIFSICAWMIYSILLLGRMLFGWRGKKAVKFSLIAFVFLFLSYFGSKFVLEILLP